MKHIFKKLHIGGSHESSRSSESPTSIPATCASDHERAIFSQNSSPTSANHPSASSSPVGASAAGCDGAVTPGGSTAAQPDYLSSEEDFQMQMALAISASSSNSEDVDYPEKEQIRAATRLSLGQNQIDLPTSEVDTAEALSRQYWDYSVLDYEERIVDGFYDVFGLWMDSPNLGKMPSLTDLESKNGNSRFEVVIINRTIDNHLEELVQVAHCMAMGFTDTEIEILVQRLAELVTENMGGPVEDANVMLARWMERSTELRKYLHTSVLPIGSVSVGLSRHRALLFKVLADNVGMPCRLVKGSQYTGVEDDAVNIIKLKNKREFLVDLMAAPGTLIPVDMPSWKENAFSAYDPNLCSKVPVLHANNVFGLNGSIPVSIDGNNKSEIKKPAAVNLPLASRKPNIQRIEHQLKNNDDDGAVEKPDPFSSTVGNFMGHRNCDIIVPDSKQTVEDSKNLFVDLNPFGAALQSKIPVKNKRVDNMVDLQKHKDILVLGRPPLPLKNRHACNEIPKNKENGGIIFKNSRKPNDCYFSALPSSSSSPALASSSSPVQDNVQRDIYKFDCASYNDGSASLALASDLIQLDDFPQAVNLMGTQMENQLREMVNKHVGAENESKGVNPSDPVINIKLKELEITSLAVDYGNNRVLDDVGDCEISWDDLVIGERIGLGSYGEVYHADWNGTEVAVKKFLDQDFSGAALEEFRREIRIMQRLRHPNIVLFMGAVTRPPNLSIVTEFLPRGSLYRILHRPHFLIDEKRRIKMALDVAKGMNCLHSSIPTIVHRDLKSPNLLVDKNWNVKVCDFGLSRLKHNTFLSSKSTAGTPEWMAPEVLRNEPSNEKCDVYSFGVILWELATLRFPWSGMNPMQVVGAVGFQNRHLEIPKEVDPLVSKIILECWQTSDPNLRPSFAQLEDALKPLQQLVIPVKEIG